MKSRNLSWMLFSALTLAASWPAAGAQPGQKLWEFQTGGPVRSSPALGMDGTVYVLSGDRRVYALEEGTGRKRWEYQIGGGEPWSSPAIAADGTVYVGSIGPDNKVYALDGATGRKRWEFKTGGEVFSSPAIGPDGTVYVGSGDHRVYALNGATGQKRWEFLTGGSVFSSPAIGADGTVYVGSTDGKVYALEGATGNPRWQFQSGGAVSGNPAIGADGTVYLGSADGKVYALNGTTGQKVWEFARADQQNDFVQSPSPAIGPDGTVYVGALAPDNKIYALHQTAGRKLWEFQTGWDVYSSPAIGADGTVYVGSGDGNVYALDAATGNRRWAFSTGGYQVFSSPAIGTDGTLYIGADDGRVYALSSESVGGLASSPWPRFRANPLSQGRVHIATGPPRISVQSASRRVAEGTPVTFEVLAEGAEPLNYQWFLNGSLLPDVNGPAYRVPAWSASEVGNYRVRVSNAEGAAESVVMDMALGYEVTIGVVGPGRVDGTTETGIYAPDSMLELTAVAAEGCLDPGCRFTGWSGDATGAANPLRLTVEDTLRLTATFGGTKPGTKLWEFEAGGTIRSSPAIAADGTVYLAVDFPAISVSALDGATGQKLWSSRTSGCCALSSPAVGPGGIVYVGDYHGVYALDALTGERRWMFQTGREVFSSPAIGVDGTVYVGSGDNKVYALNGTTGQKRWEFPTAGAVFSSPAIGTDGTVYVGSSDQKVYALNGTTGLKRWEFLTGGEVWSSPAIGTDETVYVGSGDNRVYALNAVTGLKRWEFLGGSGVHSSPALGTDGTVYVVLGDGNLYALESATGRKRWEFPSFSATFFSPAIGADGTVYVGSYNGDLYALAGTTGQALWKYQTGANERSSPTIAKDGTIYVGSLGGRLYALSSSSVGGLAPSSWPKFRGDAQNTGRAESLAVSPQFTLQPSGQRVAAGNDWQLSVSSSGTAPLTYQWFFNGAAIPGQTNDSLVFKNVQPANAGSYTVVVSNRAGSATSQVAVLTVVTSPLFVTKPVAVTTLAGTGNRGFLDGAGAQARFSAPNGAFVDAAGDVWIADGDNHRIRKVTLAGFVTTVAGTGAPGFRDGPAALAQFSYPLGLCVDTAGNVFVADTGNNRIRRIGIDGQVMTIAGEGVGGYRDGPSAAAWFNAPNDIVADADGNLWVTEFDNHTVRKITPAGTVSTWAGDGHPGYRDGPSTQAELSQPGGIAIDRDGNLYVAEWGGQRVRKIGADGQVTTLAGDGTAGYQDGAAGQARFRNPDGIAVDGLGYVYVADNGNHAIRRIDAGGWVETVAGTGEPGRVDGAGSVAQFFNPAGIGTDGRGTLFVADAGNQVVRRILMSHASLLASRVQTSKPAAHWRLGETTGTVARDAMGTHPGSYLHGVTLGEAGALPDDWDTAAGFDGVDDLVEVPSAAAWKGSLFSLEFWAKPAEGAGYRAVVSALADGPPRGYAIYLAAGGAWEFWTARMDSPTWDNLVGTPAGAGRWAHVVATYDGATKRLYVDGVLVAGRRAAYRPSTTATLHLGGAATGWDAPYGGFLDEVAVYERALGPEEVRDHYAAGSRPDGLTGLPAGRGTIALVWFTGVLEEAGTPTGPWQTVAGASSPWTIQPSALQHYYRLDPPAHGTGSATQPTNPPPGPAGLDPRMETRVTSLILTFAAATTRWDLDCQIVTVQRRPGQTR